MFKMKYNSDGFIFRYKTNLVVKGIHQTYRVGYTKTFNPIVKASTVRIVLSVTVVNRWAIHQVDVKNAFLNGFFGWRCIYGTI